MIGALTRPSCVWASDSWKLVMMTPDEVNRRTHATDVDVKSIMKLGAAGAEAGRSCCCRGMWSSDYSKLVTMTTYEVNDDGDAPGLDVRSVMELDAASSEAGLRCKLWSLIHVAGGKVLTPQRNVFAVLLLPATTAAKLHCLLLLLLREPYLVYHLFNLHKMKYIS